MRTNSPIIKRIGLRLFSVMLILLWAVMLFLVFSNSFSSTPFQFSVDTKSSIANFFPEGWGFFTKNPREITYDCLVLEEEEYRSIVEPCSNRKYLFGISRECRVIGAELEYLAEQVKDSLWLSGKDHNKLGFEEFQNERDTILNTFVNPNILGEIVLLKRDKIPWAWSKNYDNIQAPYDFVKIYVSRN